MIISVEFKKPSHSNKTIAPHEEFMPETALILYRPRRKSDYNCEIPNRYENGTVLGRPIWNGTPTWEHKAHPNSLGSIAQTGNFGAFIQFGI
jgi:hypothetical protein